MPPGAAGTVPEPFFITMSVYDLGVNIAVTLFAASGVTWHVVAVPLHAPPQPANEKFVDAGVAVSVTGPGYWNDALQVPLLQLIPAGDELTVPEPFTVTSIGYELAVNVAVTVFAASIVTWHVVPVPVQPPLQLVNV